MRRAGGRQVDQGDPLQIRPIGQNAPPQLRRQPAVEGHGAKVGQGDDQPAQVGGLRRAYGGVQTAGSLRRGDDVPQPDAMRPQAIQPLLIGQGGQTLAQQAADQGPEAVARMGVVLGRLQRGVAR
ncbi:hypothetical protein D3C87_1705410 [compost metagenome]